MTTAQKSTTYLKRGRLFIAGMLSGMRTVQAQTPPGARRRNPSLRVVLTCLTSFFLMVLAQTAAAQTGSITGTVKNSLTNAVIAGVTVNIYTSTAGLAASPTTNASGVYTATGLPTGTYFAQTSNSMGLRDLLYNRPTCTPGPDCGPLQGTAIPVTAPDATTIDFALDSLVQPPLDQQQSLMLGPVVLTTYNPVTMTQLENGTYLYFTARNQDTRPLTLQFTSLQELRSMQPVWIHDLYIYAGFLTPSQPTNIRLDAGETRTLTFFISKDVNAGEVQQAQFPFRFQVVETGDQGTMTITVSGDGRADLFRVKSAVISGRVTSADLKPIPGALVTLADFNSIPVEATSGRTDSGLYQTRTDADGRYRLDVLSIDDIKTVLGPRPFPYHSIDYFLTAEADGYAMAYRGGIAPATAQTVTVDASLQPLAQKTSYKLVGELPTDGTLSYWWIRFAGNGDRVVAVQGQHPPVAPGPQHIIAVDLTGKELWRVVTGGQCWGLDVSPDGSLIAAGCDDHFVYIISSDDGQLLQKVYTGDRPGGGKVDDVRFSPDGKYLVADGAGGAGGFSVLDAQTGQTVWKSSALTPGDDALGDYKSRWTADGMRLAVSSGGVMAMLTANGTLLWRFAIGAEPLWLEVDDAYNVYVGTKAGDLFSFDKDGNQRWYYRLATTTNEAWKGITADGTFMVLPTFNGVLQAFNPQGQVMWQHFMPPTRTPLPPGAPTTYGPGHNALSMTPTGNLIAVGSRGYQVLLYDRNGTLLWSHLASARSDFQGPPPTYTGVNSVSISPDGKYIAAGYADSVIRIFAATQGTVNLVSGWNLLGNSSSAVLDVAATFGDTSKVTTVWKWIVSKFGWAFYTPSLGDGGAAYAGGKGYDFLTTINGGEGFWVNAKSAFSVQLPSGSAVFSTSFQNMASGWNLIAVGDSPTPRAFNNAINVTTLWAWDAVKTNWYFYAPSLDAQGGSALSDYITSKSYLDFGTMTLDPTMGFWVNKP